MSKLKRTVSLLLALMITAGCLAVFSGCGRTQKMPEKRVVDHVYKMNEIALPEGVDGINNLSFCNDRIYFVTYSYDDKYNQSTDLWSMNTDGEDMKKEALPAFDENETVQTFTMTSTGLVIITYNWSYDETSGMYTEAYYANYFDKDNKLINKYNITETLGIDNNNSDQYVYISSYNFADNGDLFIVTNMYAASIGADGVLKKKYELGISDDGNTYINSVLKSGKDKYMVVLVSYDDNGEKVTYVTADLTTGELSKPADIPAALSNNYYNLTAPSGTSTAGYEFYTNSYDGIYGYDIETDSITLLLNWLNSDMTDSNLNNMVFIGDDTLFGTTYDPDTYDTILVRMNRVPEEQLVPKYVITLATSGGAYDLRTAIVKFNRQNDEYRIELKSYEEQNSGVIYSNSLSSSAMAGGMSSSQGSGISGLNSDILAGNIPDMLLVSDEISMDSYINKGLFVNLYDLMDKDETFDKSQYLTNIFKAYEINGKLYEIIPRFFITALAAKTKFLNDTTGWTMDEFVKFVNSFPEGTMTFMEATRDQFISMILSVSYDTFVDRSTGKCNFDGSEFKQLLEYAKNMRTTSIYDDAYKDGEYDEDFWNDINNAYRNDKAIISINNLYDFTTIMDLETYTFYEPVSFAGWPSTDKSTGAITDAGIRVAVSSKTALKDGCWQFIKYLLSDTFQERENTSGFAVKLSALQKQAEKAKERNYGSWNNDGIVYGELPVEEPVVVQENTTTATEEDTTSESTDSSFNVDVDVDVDVEEPAPEKPIAEDAPTREEKYITDAQIEQVMAVIKGATHVVSYNEELMNIITEEAAAYFDGKKTLDETVKIIQNKATMFINESR